MNLGKKDAKSEPARENVPVEKKDAPAKKPVAPVVVAPKRKKVRA